MTPKSLLAYKTSWNLKTSKEIGFSTTNSGIFSGTSLIIFSASLEIYYSGVSPIPFPEALGYPSSNVSINSL